MIQSIQGGDHATNAEQEAETEESLETKTTLILKLAAIASHAEQHLGDLDRFGSVREDINQLREETNYLLQQAEGLFNGLEDHLQALQSMRNERMANLQGTSAGSPEEKQKIEVEMMRIQSNERIASDKIKLAAKIAEDKTKLSIAQRADKSRDRALKEREIALKGKLDIADKVIKNKQVTKTQKGKTNGTTSTRYCHCDWCRN
jgi:hypothetical protein